MTKSAIRKVYKQKRIDLSPAVKDRLEDLILIQFQSLHLQIPDMVMTYAPIEAMNEYDPVLVEEYCFFKNPAAKLIFPVVDKANNNLKAVTVKEDTFFELNEFDIEEPMNGKETSPEAVELMIVPLLAFDSKGYRVGYGKGYYDKFISECRPGTMKIGFSFFDAEIIDDVNSFDQKLDFCITPERIYQF
ncbi:MAG: 5-formyltetrahydrofolate cyclo-ligase [Ferruginibacter sp.]